MKTIKYRLLIGILITCTFFSGCNDSFEEVNRSGLTDDPFYKTELGVRSLVNSCYSFTRLFYGKEHGWAFSDTGTDIFLRGGDCKTSQYSDYQSGLNSEDAINKQFWDMMYHALNTCNTAILRVNECKELKEVDKKQLSGEVHFIRALFLHLIVETWGGVYLTTEPSTSISMNVQRSSIEDFYNLIIEDLEYAVDNCAVQKHLSGRITQYAAKAILSRVLLYRASADYIKSPDKNADYQASAKYAKEIINSNVFSLWNDYTTAWSMNNAEGSANSEVVWYVDYADDEIQNRDLWNWSTNNGSIYYDLGGGWGGFGGSKGHITFTMKYDNQPGMERDILNGRPFQRFMPSYYLLSLFDENKDQRWKGSFKTVWIANSEKNIDKNIYPRMEIGDTAIYTYKGVATQAMKDAAEGKYLLYDVSKVYDVNNNYMPLSRGQWCQPSKYIDDKRATIFQEWSSRDMIVVRLAELYLIASEAELGLGNKAEALKYLNDLRRIRALAGKEDEMRIKESELNIDFILDERARELFAEQNRWFDLKRTGTLLNRVKQHNPDAAQNIKEHHIWKPIPQTFLDAIDNSAEFGQNEGY